MDVVRKIFFLFIAVELVMVLLYILKPNLPRFPGDINFDKIGFRVYIPFASALVLTVLLSFLLNFVGV